MKVWVLAVSNSEGCCRPDVFDSKAKAVAKMTEDYMKEVEESEAEEGYRKSTDNGADKKGCRVHTGKHSHIFTECHSRVPHFCIFLSRVL